MTIVYVMIINEWRELRKLYKVDILLMRVGDFYETFDTDAWIMSGVCDTIIVKRDEIPMTGCPHFAVESYIEDLIEAGYTVAVIRPQRSRSMRILEKEILKKANSELEGTIVWAGEFMDKQELRDQADEVYAAWKKLDAVLNKLNLV